MNCRFREVQVDERSFSIGDPETALIRVAAIINPISEDAQRWSGLLQWLSKIENVSTTVYFDPNIEAKEVGS